MHKTNTENTYEIQYYKIFRNVCVCGFVIEVTKGWENHMERYMCVKIVFKWLLSPILEIRF